MACFIVPATEAVITGVASKIAKNNEKTSNGEENVNDLQKVKLSTKLGWLTKMLTGGSVLLAFEHVWHGEVVPFFPFLTAMKDPGEAAEMFHEMATVGVTMAVIITAVWAGMLAVSSHIEKKSLKRGEAK